MTRTLGALRGILLGSGICAVFFAPLVGLMLLGAPIWVGLAFWPALGLCVAAALDARDSLKRRKAGGE